ncbi:MAG: ATP-dependent DNA helicase RecQ [Bacteroidota bacterium]
MRPASPQQILNHYWGFKDFRNPQKEIIDSILGGADVLALLPTGGGKSLCFQIPALAREGICIVISPLVALITDQVNALRKRNIKAASLIGGLSSSDVDIILDNCIYGNYKFLYLSPERLQQRLVQERIKQMNVNLIAIDEAHCISEWGHDFRPAYLKCGILRTLHPKIPVVALTATATPRVVQDIKNHLAINKGTTYSTSFARPNIAFAVDRQEGKDLQLQQLLEKEARSSIVYVSTRRDTVRVSKMLNGTKKKAIHFHGGLSSQEKEAASRLWFKNEIQHIVATSAFGMGVDKPDVGLVVHYDIPESLEAYLQQAGRAGRDGRPARAVLLTTPGEEVLIKKRFLETLPDLKTVKEVYKKLNAYFNIAFAEGLDTKFELDLTAFCQRYQLSNSKVYAALSTLAQYGVLQLGTNWSQRATLRFTAKKGQLLHWMDRNNTMATVVGNILRTYGGLFEYDTPVDITQIARHTKSSIQNITRVLQTLHHDGLANYRPISRAMGLTFLVPREDEVTLHAIAPQIKKWNALKKRKLGDMLRYVTNENRCRTQVLLEYFGEQDTEVCGKCDVCKRREKKSDMVVRQMIIDLLRMGNCTSREIAQQLEVEDSKILYNIRELLASGQIVIKPKNTYGLK